MLTRLFRKGRFHTLLVFLGSAHLLSVPKVSVAAEQTKTAVIVSAGDLASLENSMKQLEKQGIEAYQKLGFKVILIGGVERGGKPLTPQSLIETLGSLRGVQDLRVDFIGHGNVARSTRDDSSDIAVSEDRVRQSFDSNSLSGAKKMVWYAANSQNLDQSAMYFSAKAKQWTGITPQPQQPVTHREVEEALSQFRRSNPDGITTINLLNCFSGAIAQKLRKTPNTIVFANSPHNTVALDLGETLEEQQKGITTRKADLGSVNGLQRYYTAIGGDYRFTSVGEAIEEKHGLLSLNAARGWANRKMAERLRDEPTSIGMVGRSPSFESVIGWCEEGKPGRLQTSRSRQALEANETTHSLAFHLEHEAKELERRVKYAQNAPDPNEPEKGRLQKSKEDFERCEADVASSAKARAEKEADYKRRLADWKSEREPFLDDPKAPFRYLLTSLDTAVADSSKSGVIRDRFMDSIKNDLHNLRRSGLPRVRWGAIEKLIVDVEAGRTTSDWIVAKVKQQLKDIRTACINGDFEKSPCYPEKWIPLRNLSTLLLGIGVPVPAKVADGRLMNNCATGESFGCIYKTDTNSAKLPMAFERYWGPKPILDEASTSCGTDFYSGAEWVGFQKTLANVKMDKECVEDFILRAPDDEFENLNRLHKLGNRDARGYVDVAPKARTERSKLKKVTK